MQYDTTEGAQGICPDGWHIPTLSEFHELSDYANGERKNLLAVGETDVATNETGFSALLTGFYESGNFSWLGDNTSIWSTTVEDYSDKAFTMALWLFDDDVVWHRNDKDEGYSVRCLRD